MFKSDPKNYLASSATTELYKLAINKQIAGNITGWLSVDNKQQSKIIH